VGLRERGGAGSVVIGGGGGCCDDESGLRMPEMRNESESHFGGT